MTFSTSLTNHFLIAMPGLQDPNFSRTVTYVCEHTEQGAMGIVINRPMEIRLGEMLGQLEQEMSANAWLSGPADEEIIFKLSPSARWQAAAHLLGVDLNLLSGEAGHA
jgi:putative AlgH/UPF0301 family transcriptional regulator